MRIKGLFFILVFLLLALGGILLFLSSQQNTLFFYIGEGLILFILIYLVFFYRKLIKPLNTIGSGMDLLREQDFSSRLSPVGQYEADRVVNVFNRMMEQLKNERLRLREQNHFLDLLINASPMGVIITTLDDDLSQLNPMALKMLGVRPEDVQGKKMKEIDSPLANYHIGCQWLQQSSAGEKQHSRIHPPVKKHQRQNQQPVKFRHQIIRHQTAGNRF